ncbi:hypothetical protein FD755_009149 [Muntiacus reevesi]|uniref:Uncharacterized protein n=2 Tax=Muntiacus TaxID=9885 RepID=A0A5J5MLZ6_MUNRE|nr:hypothetical protein FD754_008460 [Muntiacus muntjak]KAB0381365.1 hypothetical protein FD755_009149 [Muntiacus reevesi]
MRLRNGTVATVLAFITSFLTLSWYTTWQNGKGKENVSRKRSWNEVGFLLCQRCINALS